MNQPDAARLAAAASAVQRLVRRMDSRSIIIGGFALGLLANPRYTADVDLVVLVSVDDVEEFLEYGMSESLTPRIVDAAEFARRNRVLLLCHEETGVEVDVSFGALPFEIEAVERGLDRTAGGIPVRVATPEDLIVMKAVAHRPQDLADIAALVDAFPTLDRQRVRHWVTQFAEVLDTPELWTDIALLIEGNDRRVRRHERGGA